MSETRRFADLVCHVYGAATAKTLFVFVHGDRRVRTGVDWAQDLVTATGAAPVRAVALVRPGYDERTGEIPDDEDGHVRDQYTARNILQIGRAIDEMKRLWNPVTTIGIGFSGGAACMGVLIGLRPRTVSHAVLVSGPLDLEAWRKGRTPYPRSLSALDYIDRIPQDTRIRCIHGKTDKTISVTISQTYAARAKAAGLDATIEVLEGAYHNSFRRLGDAAIKAARALA